MPTDGLEEEREVDATSLYMGGHFGLFIDLRTMAENSLHGSGLRLVNSEGSIQLELNRVTSGSGNVNCYIFIISDAQANVMNSQLESVQY